MFFNKNNNSNSDNLKLAKLYEDLGKEVFTQMQNKPLDMDNKVFFDNLMETAMNICVGISSELMAAKGEDNAKTNNQDVNNFDFGSNFDVSAFADPQQNNEPLNNEIQTNNFYGNAPADNEPMNDLFTDLSSNNAPANNLFGNAAENNMFNNTPLNDAPMFCPNCGSRLENGNAFCTKCGTRIG